MPQILLEIIQCQNWYALTPTWKHTTDVSFRHIQQFIIEGKKSEMYPVSLQ